MASYKPTRDLYSTGLEIPNSLSRSRSTRVVVKKVYDLRSTRELLKSRLDIYRSLSNSGQIGVARGTNPTKQVISPPKLPRLVTPAQLPSSRQGFVGLAAADSNRSEEPNKSIMSAREQAESRPRLPGHMVIEAKRLEKTTVKGLSTAISAGSLRPSSHLRRLSEGSRGVSHMRMSHDPTSALPEEHTLQSDKPPPAKGELVNTVTKCGYKTRTGTSMGVPKRNNQDCFSIVPNVAGQRGHYVFAVYDGHGVYGHSVSGMLAERLPELLATHVKTKPTGRIYETGIERSFGLMQQELIRSSVDCSLSGSTACVVLVRGASLFTANVGDSRAIVGRRVKNSWTSRPLSRDHKADWPDEHKRIIEAGGRVKPCMDHHGNALGPQRVWLSTKNIPGLAMSRSFGDLVGSEVGVIASPEIKRYDLSADDKFIVIASDGLWEFMSNQEVVEIVAADFNSAAVELSCEKLVKESVRRWKRQEETVDDITVVIVYLTLPA